jgi:hypothetical protein
MTDWLARLAGHRQVLIGYWLLNAALILGLLAFALR